MHLGLITVTEVMLYHLFICFLQVESIPRPHDYYIDAVLTEIKVVKINNMKIKTNGNDR